MNRLDKMEIVRLREFAIAVLGRQGPLTPSESEAVRAGLAEMQTFSAGTELIAEGAALDQPLLLLDGWAMRQRVLKDGRRQVFSFVLPGDAIGLCARRNGLAACSTLALTQVTLAPMPALAAALHAGTALGSLARALLSQEETFLYNHVVRLGRQSAQERLIGLLLELHTRLDQVGLAQDGSFSLPLTQEVLSDALGLSVVHTNRTLQQLKRDHLIASQGNNISLADLSVLADMADYSPLPRHR